MKSTFDNTTGLYTLLDEAGEPLQNSPRFKRFTMSVAFPEPGATGDHALSWLLVGGEDERRKFQCFHEAQGPLGEMAIPQLLHSHLVPPPL